MRLLLACLLALLPLMAHAEDLGTLSANEVVGAVWQSVSSLIGDKFRSDHGTTLV